ncbi:MAG: extracellular solute-binding protein, partial [Actinomycetota bacterium]
LLSVGALVVAALLLASACTSGGDRLTVYSGRTENLIGPLLEDFVDETGIKIDVRYGGSEELALLIETEEENGNSPADVFISQSPGAVGFLTERDLLAPLGQEVLDLVDEENRSSEGTWVGLSGRVRVLVYDTDEVDEADLPASVLDLTDPEYQGQVAVAPSNGSFQDFVSGMRAELGDDATADWLDGMAANDSPVYANNTAIVEAVGRGEVPMGLVNHYYNFRALEEDPSASSANHSFEPGDIGNLLIDTAMGVLASSDRSEDADALVRFLLSRAAQEFFSQETFEYPLAAGVEPAPELTPLSELDPFRIDLDELGSQLERTRELIDQSGLG